MVVKRPPTIANRCIRLVFSYHRSLWVKAALTRIVVDSLVFWSKTYQVEMLRIQYEQLLC